MLKRVHGKPKADEFYKNSCLVTFHRIGSLKPVSNET